MGQFPVSRLFAQLKPGLINTSPLAATYPALLVRRLVTTTYAAVARS